MSKFRAAVARELLEVARLAAREEDRVLLEAGRAVAQARPHPPFQVGSVTAPQVWTVDRLRG